ncbi:MAG: peptidoglycan-binding protein [Cyanobacteria bacterium J06627_28]
MSVQTLIRRCSTTNDQPILRFGDAGADVEAMQQLLSESTRRFDNNNIYGLGDAFGSVLESVVQEFQRQVFLTSDGIVGPNTWKALCSDGPVNMPMIEQGSQSESVRQIQTRLAQAGYYTAVIDADFGPVTYAAVTQFQQDQGLSADGIVGPLTWNALSRV